MLIMMFVMDELSYDRYNTHANQTYRMAFDGQLGESAMLMAQTSAPMAQALVNDYPEVLWATRFRDRGSYIVKVGKTNDIFKEEGVLFADSNVFKTFDFELLQGNPENALANPNSVVITKELAYKYFGDENAIGQALTLDNKIESKVTGIMAKIPSNTHFTADMFVSLPSLENLDMEMQQWTNFNFQTYIVLEEDADPDQLEAKFPGMTEKYIGPQIEKYLGITLAEFEEQGNRFGFFMNPLTDIHLRSSYPGELGNQSDIKYVYVFSAIALFILLIACINFMNLSTAKSAGRAREVGVRKALGSRRSQLISQFLNESILLSALAFIFAVLLAYLTLPYFNLLSGKELVMPFNDPQFYAGILGGILVVGFLSGSYPAFFLSSFSASSILKGNLSIGVKSGRLRSILVVFQFATSIILVAGTLVIYNQLEFIQNKKLGYSKDQVLIIQDTYVLDDQIESFKNKLTQYPEVINATISGFLPVSSNSSSTSYFPKDKGGEYIRVVNIFNVDTDYIPTMGIEMSLGRNFDPEIITDSTAVIVNEALIKLYEFDEEPIGSILARYGDDPDQNEEYRIIGVVKDFHFQSLKEDIRPMLFHLRRSTGSISLKVETEDLPGLITKVENEWKSLANGQPFTYSFLEERFDNMYRQEKRTGRIAIVFSSLAILVACMGLFGLAAFTAEQKTKEIGVRKVMGASISNIVLLLNKDFSRLILFSIILATPVAWFLMDKWLAEFSYRIDLNPTIFLGAGVLSMIIAWLTMGYQSYKAASANPATSLRDE